MTDEEVKKGLGDCKDVPNCVECPYQHSKTCQDDLHHDALALINRLEAEKEEVRKETAKGILQYWYDDVVHGMGVDGYYIKEYAKKYGVEVE